MIVHTVVIKLNVLLGQISQTGSGFDISAQLIYFKLLHRG